MLILGDFNLPTDCQISSIIDPIEWIPSTGGAANFEFQMHFIFQVNHVLNRNSRILDLIFFDNRKPVQKLSSKPQLWSFPSCILTNCCEIHASPITDLFTFSLCCGTFPDVWKSLFIIPQHKSDSKSLISKYRGIAKLRFLPNIFEYIVF